MPNIYTHHPLLNKMENILYYSAWTSGLIALSIIGFLFGVPRIKDPLILTFKRDSKILNKVIANTKLGTMHFTTCYAGTFS